MVRLEIVVRVIPLGFRDGKREMLIPGQTDKS